MDVDAAMAAYIVVPKKYRGTCTLLGEGGLTRRTTGTPFEGSYPAVGGTLVVVGLDPRMKRVYGILQGAREELLRASVGDDLSSLHSWTWRMAPWGSDLHHWNANHHFFEESRLVSNQKTRLNQQ